MKLKIYFIAFITLILGLSKSFAQNCFEIESILVDACGSPEGSNEMVRFQIGNTALNVNDLTVTWPNNSFKGICQDAGTALKVDSLNQTILGCGLLLEPVGGVLPANAHVLLSTSTDMSVSSNSFAALNDTLIIIFQCSGNVSGHFANNNPVPGLRTLIMTFSNPSNCSDTATYDRALLINQGGTYGGPSAFNDGAFVEFTSQGVATYLNNGCQALINALVANAGPDLIYCGNPLNLTGSISGTASGYQWTTSSGTLSTPNLLTTTFTPTPGLTGSIYVNFNASGSCSVVDNDSVQVYMPTIGLQNILSANNSLLSCSLLSFNYTYNWSLDGTPLSSATGPFLVATVSGCYQVIVTDGSGCSVTSDTVCIVNAGINEINTSGINVTISEANETMQLSISATNAINDLDVVIYSSTGQLITKENYEKVSNKFQTTINTSQWQHGVYYISLQGENFVKNEKVVLVK